MGKGFDSKCNFTPPTMSLELLLCLGCGVSFSGRIQQSPVDGCSSVSCSFGVLTGEDVLYMGLFFHFIYKSLISK